MLVGRDVKMAEQHLAIVLLDLIGSTDFVQKHGARAAAIHFQNHDRLTRSLLFKFKGREIDRSDGFLCSFQNPIDAVNFSLHYQKSIPIKTGIGCRIGIHWDVIIEVHQDDVWVAANAKRVELEGLGKNIAARTMSLCKAGQILLTRQAMDVIRHRTNKETPPATRYAFVGFYRFKGVKSPQEIYAVGESIESLQPPSDTEKAKKVNGPNKVRLNFSLLNRKEKIDYLIWRLGWVSIFMWIAFFYMFVSYPIGRTVLGLESLEWIDAVNRYVFELIISMKRGYDG